MCIRESDVLIHRLAHTLSTAVICFHPANRTFFLFLHWPNYVKTCLITHSLQFQVLKKNPEADGCVMFKRSGLKTFGGNRFDRFY